MFSLVYHDEGNFVPFWLQDSRIIAVTRRISTRNRIIITITALALLVLTWGYFFYFPIHSHSNGFSREIKQLAQQISQHEEAIAKNAHDHQSHDLHHELQAIFDQHQSVHDSVDFMFMKIKELGLTCKGLNPLKTKKEKNICKQYFDLSVQGSFKKILVFIESLHKSPCSISFDSFDVQRDDRKKVTLSATVCFIDLV